jgi:hypothetical protein
MRALQDFRFVLIAWLALVVAVRGDEASDRAQLPLAASGEPALKVEVFPVAGAKESRITVQLTNVSTKALRLFEDWNSWGYYQLSFRVTLKNREEVMLHRGSKEWTMNYASTVLLGPGESYELKPEEFGDRHWPGSAKLKGEGPISIRAVYKSSSGEVLKSGIKQLRDANHRQELWLGTAESAPIPFRF